MENPSNTIMINYTPEQLAGEVAARLKQYNSDLINQLLDERTEDESKPLTMAEAANWLGLSRSTFSEIVGRAEIPYKSLNPDNPKAKKLFLKKDLRNWLLKNRTKTIDELKAGYNESTN